MTKPAPAKCSIGTCEEPVLAKEMCSGHYWRKKRGLKGKRLEEPLNAGDRTKRIDVRLRPKVFAAVERLAKRAGVSLSKMAENLIEASAL